MRRVKAHFAEPFDGVRRVIPFDELAGEWSPSLRFAVAAGSEEARQRIRFLKEEAGIDVVWVEANDLIAQDVIAPLPGRQELAVLHRETDAHHSLFVTNRCNSYCLMCSQPPTPQDDSWLVGQALDLVRHIKTSPKALGITGGEPLLLGHGLRLLLDEIAYLHPATRMEVLTNGRLLSEQAVVDTVLSSLRPGAAWLVPLYGHADFIHDFVVQSPGAFEQTIAGLLNLQEHRQIIQLRIVLIKPVLQVLEQLVAFIGRNLPFVREVALMACEPTGFALANRDFCEFDLGEWGRTLERSAAILHRYDVPFLFMNTPLCALPRSLRMHAHRSISDWKNTYHPECGPCAVRSDCSGLFTWADKNWLPAKINAITEVTHG